MAMAFCMMESRSWCRFSKRRKRRRRLLQKHSGGMEAGYGSRARHYNGIKSGVVPVVGLRVTGVEAGVGYLLTACL
jgi:hypothetical protein